MFRGDTDRHGEPGKQPHGTVQGVIAWASVNDTDMPRAETSATVADLYVPDGTDVRARDRIKRTNGDYYRVIGGAQWDQDHPFTGRKFGWTVYRLESMNT